MCFLLVKDGGIYFYVVLFLKYTQKIACVNSCTKFISYDIIIVIWEQTNSFRTIVKYETTKVKILKLM